MLGGSMLLYPEQIILDHAICFEVYELFNGFQFDESDLALDVIKEVGPGSHFLRHKHTREHIRDFSLSPLSEEIYTSEQRRPSLEVALEEFNRIHETHNPEPLPQEKLAELDRILSAAEREAERLQG
jgi:trimethylamine--corrinoid protein Co-methyltransferase